MSTGRLIRERMMELDVKPEQVALEGKCSITTLYNLLRDKPVREATLKRIMKYLGMAPNGAKKAV